MLLSDIDRSLVFTAKVSSSRTQYLPLEVTVRVGDDVAVWRPQLYATAQVYEGTHVLDGVTVFDIGRWKPQSYFSAPVEYVRHRTVNTNPLEATAAVFNAIPFADKVFDDEYVCLENAQNNNQTVVVMTQRWG